MTTDTTRSRARSAAGRSEPPSVGLLGGITAAAIAVIVFVIGLLIGGTGAIFVVLPTALIVGGVLAWLLVTRSMSVVLSLVGGRPAEADRDARLVNITEGLALTAGMPVPELRVIPDPTINGLVVGGIGGRDALVVTEGALEHLDRMQLEGLLAHLVIRARRPEHGSLTASVTTTGLPRLIADRLSARTGPGPVDPAVEELVVLDQEAVGLTRFPPGLAGAVEVAMDRGTAVDGARRPVSHLWFAPVADDPEALGVRLDALGEL